MMRMTVLFDKSRDLHFVGRKGRYYVIPRHFFNFVAFKFFGMSYWKVSWWIFHNLFKKNLISYLGWIYKMSLFSLQKLICSCMILKNIFFYWRIFLLAIYLLNIFNSYMYNPISKAYWNLSKGNVSCTV